MYHQNLSSRRFTSLTWELLYETPRQFTGPPTSPGIYRATREMRPTFTGRSSSRGSTRSTNSNASSTAAVGSRRNQHAPMPANATSMIAAVAFAEERERQERKRQEKEQQERGRRRERVSNATTINADGAMHEVGMEELKKELGIGGSSPREVDLEEEEGEPMGRDRKSSATLSIVLNEFEKEIGGERIRAVDGGVEDYMQNPESRIPNVPYKSVTHPDVAQPRAHSPVGGGNTMLTKPSWRKQPLDKISAKTQKIKQKFDDRKTSVTQKIPFLRNGSTMDRIKETFKFSRFSHRN
ncbi:hypothetical protein DRE_04228 [Drechslerella stenobrocha 248]|uniref:Uncharacterized protein n=1 Tax=Drechslerella stenobrocha 248 TaxID=1043628 RepID=W7IBS4_9PEZI|nr:hypothetical protein DRE_04228 [Drechslerella stenobrocha 248]